MLVLLRIFSPSHLAHVETCALPNDEHRPLNGPSKLASFSFLMEVDGGLLRLARGAGLCRCGGGKARASNLLSPS